MRAWANAMWNRNDLRSDRPGGHANGSRHRSCRIALSRRRGSRGRDRHPGKRCLADRQCRRGAVQTVAGNLSSDCSSKRLHDIRADKHRGEQRRLAAATSCANRRCHRMRAMHDRGPSPDRNAPGNGAHGTDRTGPTQGEAGLALAQDAAHTQLTTASNTPDTSSSAASFPRSTPPPAQSADPVSPAAWRPRSIPHTPAGSLG